MQNAVSLQERLTASITTLAVITKCIQDANEIDLPHYFEEIPTRTHNAVGNLRGDLINTRLYQSFTNSSVRIIEFSRQGWTGMLVIDDTHKFIYTTTSSRRLEEVKAEHKANPHYIRSLNCTLNNDVDAPNRQLSFIDICENIEGFEQDYLITDSLKILGGSISLDEGYTYCVVKYQAFSTHLKDVRAVIMDDRMHEAISYSLDRFLKESPDFGSYMTETSWDEVEEDAQPIKLVSLKNKLRKAN